MSPKLYILAGIPGCGNSTWARHFFYADMIVSTDEIRLELTGEVYNQEQNGVIFEEFHARLRERLYHGESAVADATSLTVSSREILRNIAESNSAEAHLIFFSDFVDGERRNLERERPVPEDAMQRMFEKFIDTQVAIKDEDYSSITYIARTV